MREVEIARVVAASPPTVERRLTPSALIEYEGTFAVRDVRAVDGGDATLVDAEGGGLTLTLRFERREDGLRYVQAGDAGPFDGMETTVTVEPADGGSRVRLRSAVSLGLPVPLADRIAGWKRRRELERALDALAADCE